MEAAEAEAHELWKRDQLQKLKVPALRRLVKEWGGQITYKGTRQTVRKAGLLAQVKAYLDGQDSAVAAATVTEGTAKASATEHYPETIPCPLLVIDALGVTNWGCPLYSQEMELMEEQQLAGLL